jgi:hypothetical protein
VSFADLDRKVEEAREALAKAEEARRNPPKSEAQLWDEQIAARMTEREVQATQQHEAAGRAAWEQFDTARAPGGLFANLSPHQAATMEAELLVKFGERPAPPDPYELAAEIVEKQFGMAFDLFQMNLPALSARLDAISPQGVPARIAQVKRELGVEILASQGRLDPRSMSNADVSEAIRLGTAAHAKLVEDAKKGLEQGYWNDVIAADLMSLKAFAQRGRNQEQYERAMAALPRRKVA